MEKIMSCLRERARFSMPSVSPGRYYFEIAVVIRIFALWRTPATAAIRIALFVARLIRAILR
jgi:hypothetical protein